jgi:predicted AAA+ superfamily ATPase
VARLGRNIAPDMIRRFFTMVGHYHGGVWNASDIASSLQVAHTTARGYLDLLSGTYLVRQLPPWFENVGKRVVKSPKVYVRDCGLLHTLLGIADRRSLEGHPKLGTSWEGFVLEELLGRADERHAYFWATHAGAELDLLLTLDGRRFGFEVKVTDAPRTSKSMRIALADLRLDHLYVVHPGTASFPLDEHITAVTLPEAITIVRTHRAA